MGAAGSRPTASPTRGRLRPNLPSFGPFELLRRLGSGATSEVFLAAGPNPANAELVALKILLPQVAEDERSREAMAKEAELYELLNHPNVVQLYDVGEAEARL